MSKPTEYDKGKMAELRVRVVNVFHVKRSELEVSLSVVSGYKVDVKGLSAVDSHDIEKLKPKSWGLAAHFTTAVAGVDSPTGEVEASLDLVLWFEG